jgi:hypothetical protein
MQGGVLAQNGSQQGGARSRQPGDEVNSVSHRLTVWRFCSFAYPETASAATLGYPATETGSRMIWPIASSAVAGAQSRRGASVDGPSDARGDTVAASVTRQKPTRRPAGDGDELTAKLADSRFVANAGCARCVECLAWWSPGSGDVPGTGRTR